MNRRTTRPASAPAEAGYALGIAGLIVLAVCAVLAVAQPPAFAVSRRARKAVLVGVVLPRRAGPGERISGSLVLHPSDYQSIPGLIVVPVKMKLPVDANGKPRLDRAFVDAGYGRTPGDGRFATTVPTDGTPVEVTCGSGEVARRILLPVEASTERPAASTGTYTMQPIAPNSGLSVIHGSFDGDSNGTDIRVNDTHAKVVAESFDSAFYVIPASSINGPNRVTLTQDGRTYSWNMYQPDVEIGAAKTVLQQDESTGFKVTVNLEGMPRQDWQAGNPSDLYDTSRVSAGAAGLGHGNGLILLTIKNNSMDTVSMSPGDRFTVSLTRNDAAIGTREVDGTVTAKRAGGFEIDASLVSLLADVPGHEIAAPGERIAKAEESPRPHSEPTGEAGEEEEPPPVIEGIPVGNPTPTETPGGTTVEKSPSATPTPTPACKAPFTSARAGMGGVEDSVCLTPPEKKKPAYGDIIGCKTKDISIDKTVSVPIFWVIAGDDWKKGAKDPAKAKRDAAAQWFGRYCITLDFREVELKAAETKSLIHDLHRYSDDPDAYTDAIWKLYYGTQEPDRTGELYKRIYDKKKGMKGDEKILLVMFVDHYAGVRNGERGGGAVDSVSINFMGIPVILIFSDDMTSKHILTHELTHALGKALMGRTSRAWVTAEGYTWDHVGCPSNMDDAVRKVGEPLPNADDAPVDWAAYWEWLYVAHNIKK